MTHLGTACNLLSAIGGTPDFARPNFPQVATPWYPFPFELAKFSRLASRASSARRARRPRGRWRSSGTFARHDGSSSESGLVFMHERSEGIQRASSKTLTARRCSAVSSGGSATVGRRPMPPVVVRTSFA